MCCVHDSDSYNTPCVQRKFLGRQRDAVEFQYLDGLVVWFSTMVNANMHIPLVSCCCTYFNSFCTKECSNGMHGASPTKIYIKCQLDIDRLRIGYNY